MALLLRLINSAVLVIALLAIPQIVTACDACDAGATSTCGHCGDDCCGSRMVKKVIWVPKMVTETRFKTVVIREMEEREETYTAFKRVPKEQKFTKEICYLEDKIETKTITEKKCQVVMNPGTRLTHVDVPVDEVVMRAPKCTCNRTCSCDDNSCSVCLGEPCPCTITRLKRDTRQEDICRPQLILSETKKDIFYCVKEPKKKTEVCAEEIVYELEPVTKTRKVKVCVPRIEKQPYEVCYKKMFQKTIYVCEKCGK